MAEVTLYDTGDPVKFCNGCKKNKVLADFYRRRVPSGRKIPASICKKCMIARKATPKGKLQSSQRYHRNKHKLAYKERIRQYRNSPAGREIAKNVWLKARYGIDVATFKSMRDAQNNICAICGNPESKIDRRTNRPCDLSVDHDHKTGQVRALLCGDCNRIIGIAKDDPQRLRAAAEYLEKHSS